MEGILKSPCVEDWLEPKADGGLAKGRLTPGPPYQPNKCFNMTARERPKHEAQKDESIEHRDQTETP